MGLELTCARGHQWEEPERKPGDTQRVCPRCGAPPVALFAPNISSVTRHAPSAATEPHAAAASSHPDVAGYQILDELGRGGMGVVYRAQHLALKRMVALKLVLTGGHAGPTERARFRTEAEAVARLRHPGIVQIYEVGEQEGRPYCALEYVPGGSLAQYLGGTPLPPAVAAQLIADLADAVQHAHEQGIIHRDLKPANILLTSGERRVESGESEAGRSSALRSPLSAVKITDFGLAKTLDSPDGPTRSGTVLGTPSYMSPEQALGNNRTVGPATDIYSLGAILYECVTGRPPFKAETSLDTMLMVASQDPMPPRQISPDLPRDLETICLKCLRKEPAKRYPSARELADDLGRFLRSEPIRARPVGSIERAIKWARRRPAWTAALALLLIVPLLTAAVVWKWPRKESVQPATVTPTVDLAGYAKRVVQAGQECREGKFSQAEQTLMECPAQFRNWEWHYLHRLCNWGTHRTLTDFGGPVHQVTWGKGYRLAVAAASPGIHLRDALSGKALLTVGAAHGPVKAIAFSPDLRRLAAVDEGGYLRLYDAHSGQEVAARKHGGPLRCLAFSPDGKWLVVGGGPGREHPAILWLWSAEPGKEPYRKYDGRQKEIDSVAFSPDSRWFGTLARHDSTGMKCWSVEQDTPVGSVTKVRSYRRLLFVPRDPLVGMLPESGPLEFGTPFGQRIAFEFADPPTRVGEVKLGPLGKGHLFDDQADPRAGNRVLDAAYNPGGTLVALAGGWPNQGKVRVYRGRSFKESVLFFGHAKPIESVAFSQGGRNLATGSGDGTVRIWAVAVRSSDGRLNRSPLAAPPQRPDFFTDSLPITFSRDGRRLAVGGSALAPVAIYDLVTHEKVECQGPLPDVPQDICFSPDGRQVAALTGVSPLRLVHVWDTKGGKPVPAKFRPLAGDCKLAACPDGLRILNAAPRTAFAKPAPGIQVLDPLTGETVRVLGEKHFWKAPLTLSADGERLAAVSAEGSLMLWNVPTGQVLLTSPAAPGIARLAFHGNDRYLVYPTEKDLQIWDARTGKPASLRMPPQPWDHLAALSPDGRLLALPVKQANGAFLILLWDTAAGKEVKMLRGHGTALSSLIFGADGERLFSAGQDDPALKVWDTATGLEICSFPLPGGRTARLLLAPFGRRLAFRTPENVYAWDASPVPAEAVAPAAK